MACSSLEGGDRLLDVRPCRVLRQYRADGNLERRVARPPVLWSPDGRQSCVYVGEASDRLVSSWLH